MLQSPRTPPCHRHNFSDNFLFGAASSAYQWEGAFDEDGRTLSVWDTFSHSNNRGNGDVAADGYHKYKEDVKLMAEMGLEAFRFSISWTRIIPNGRGHVNPKGVLFYKNLIKELKTHGIEPHVTLYHYDLPQSLEDEYGGWLNRKIIEDFTAYADVCFREFGDDVKLWTTINEATIFAIGSYDQGTLPPGHCSPNKFINCSTGNSSTEPYLVGHNILLAHASASKLYRLKYKSLGILHGIRGRLFHGDLKLFLSISSKATTTLQYTFLKMVCRWTRIHQHYKTQEELNTFNLSLVLFSMLSRMDQTQEVSLCGRCLIYLSY